MKIKLARWKKQIVCVGLGLVLGGAAQMLARTDTGLTEGYVLARNGYGQGEASYQIYVEGLEEEAVPLDVNLAEQVYTEEEAHNIYTVIMEELPLYILGDNISLQEVRSDLNLITYLDQYGISLRWESEEPELVNSFGEVNSEGLKEEGQQVYMRVRLTEGNWPCEYMVPVTVKPPVFTEQEQRRNEFLKLLAKEDRRQNTTKTMRLPSEFQGKALSYQSGTESTFWPMVGLGVAAAVLLAVKDKEDIRKSEAVRKQQMMLDYSEVLSRLIIFLGAGMSIRTAWDKIAFDQHQMVQEGRRKPRYVYKEMYETSCQMKSGMSVGNALAQFGSRCGLQPYIKLSGLLEQNRKNGSRNLRDTLKLEMAEAFEQRKHQARRLGEEAGTKLLLPLFMMLSVVMIMIAVPALMEFG